jgi:hypothetical protein
MLRNVFKVTVIWTVLLCCSAAFAQVLIAPAEPAAKGQQAVFKIVNVSQPVCVALFQTNDAGALLTLSTYYLGTLQTKQVTPPVVLHYRTTSLFALFDPLGGTPTSACISIPTLFLSDPNRRVQIYETLAGGDGPPVTITQLVAAANVAQQNCSATGSINNSTATGGIGGNANGGAGGAGGAGGNGNASGTSTTVTNTTVSGTLTITQSGGNGGNGGAGGAGGAGGTGGNGTGGSLTNTVSGNCNGNRNISQSNSIIQDATAIVVFGFEEINFRTGDPSALTSALVNCPSPSLNTAGAVLTVSCTLPTTGGTFSSQTL